MSSSGALVLAGQQQAAGFQAFVDTSNVMVATTTPGTPAAGTFYSSIVGRAALPDFNQDLKPRFATERIMTQQAYNLQNEFGASGQPVYAAVNDTFGQIRFIGNWSGTLTGGWGQAPLCTETTGYVEITFLGTGLNFLGTPSLSFVITASVDGGSYSSNIWPSTSNVLCGRLYSSNTVFPVFSGLPFGVHTITLQIVGGNSPCLFGFEILNEASTIKVPPGSSYTQGRKIVTSSLQSLAYNSTFDAGTLTAANGGRVQVIQKADGSIVKRVNSYSGSPLYLTNVNHATCLEEVARTYHWREFGAGRSDDFSLLSYGAAAFTLDDGVTTLLSDSCQPEFAGFTLNNSSNFMIFTFVGTGLDLTVIGGPNITTAEAWPVYIDGSNVGTISSTVGTTKIVKIASGLPYGTHTCKLVRSSVIAYGEVIVKNFIVYQPKKTTLNSGEVELADYNIMRTYVANSTAGLETIAAGVLRKASVREFAYTGSSWGVDSDTTVLLGGFGCTANASGATLSYTFFGTGFELRSRSGSDRSNNLTFTLRSLSSGGSALAVNTTNFTINGSGSGPAITTSVYGGFAFTPSSGIFNENNTSTPGSGFTLSGLTLGLWKVVLTNNTSNRISMDCLDIITPIHSHKSNIYADLQNTLPVGSCAISDNRKFTPVKDVLPANKAWAQAVGVTSTPTTTSTSPVPVPDMSCSIKTGVSYLEIIYSASVANNILGNAIFSQIYVDGIPVGTQKVTNTKLASDFDIIMDIVTVPVGSGFHKIDLYWWTSGGTATNYVVDRTMVVKGC